MQVVYLDLANLPILPKIALTIGNFDGVHLGHQAMLSDTLKVAHSHGLKSAVMLFEPQPKEFFDPTHAPARLSNLKEKLARLSLSDIDFVFVCDFDDKFANLSPDAFCALLKNLNTNAVILGDDFRFGKKRAGDIALLKQHFAVHQVDSVVIDNQRVSSTLIRQALQTHNLALAKRLLGYDYYITGEVVHGDKIGRTLNFPTANIALKRIKPALNGIFGVAVSCNEFDSAMGGIRLDDDTLFGCANIGTRPSVHGQEHRLEVHLPNFSGDLYGKILSIRFLHFLHGEVKYNSLDALKQGIANDIQALLTWQKTTWQPSNHTPNLF